MNGIDSIGVEKIFIVYESYRLFKKMTKDEREEFKERMTHVSFSGKDEFLSALFGIKER